jgi:hypothetical protein
MGRGIAQGRAQADAPPPELRVIRNILLAQQLADYGMEVGSPEALAVAAQILRSNPTRSLEVQQKGADAPPRAEMARAPVSPRPVKPVPDPLQLLKRAEDLAAGDEAALAWLKRLRILRSTRLYTEGTGNVATRLLQDSVEPGKTRTYTIQFQGGELARVTVASDQGASLDLAVYDESNRLVEKGIARPSGECFAVWNPAQTQMFRIEVKNPGNASTSYMLATN